MARNDSAVTKHDLDRTKAAVLQELHSLGKLAAERLRAYLVTDSAAERVSLGPSSAYPQGNRRASSRRGTFILSVPARQPNRVPATARDEAPLLDRNTLEELFRHRIENDAPTVMRWHQEMERRLQAHTPTPGSTPHTADGSGNSPAFTCPTSPLLYRQHAMLHSRLRSSGHGPASASVPGPSPGSTSAPSSAYASVPAPAAVPAPGPASRPSHEASAPSGAAGHPGGTLRAAQPALVQRHAGPAPPRRYSGQELSVATPKCTEMMAWQCSSQPAPLHWRPPLSGQMAQLQQPEAPSAHSAAAAAPEALRAVACPACAAAGPSAPPQRTEGTGDSCGGGRGCSVSCGASGGWRDGDVECEEADMQATITLRPTPAGPAGRSGPTAAVLAAEEAVGGGCDGICSQSVGAWERTERDPSAGASPAVATAAVAVATAAVTAAGRPRRELPEDVVHQIKRQHVLALINACGPRSGGGGGGRSGDNAGRRVAVDDPDAGACDAAAAAAAAVYRGGGGNVGAPPPPPAPPQPPRASLGAAPVAFQSERLAETVAGAAATSTPSSGSGSGRVSPDDGGSLTAATSTATHATWPYSTPATVSARDSADPSRSLSGAAPSIFPSPRSGSRCE